MNRIVFALHDLTGMRRVFGVILLRHIAIALLGVIPALVASSVFIYLTITISQSATSIHSIGCGTLGLIINLTEGDGHDNHFINSEPSI